MYTNKFFTLVSHLSIFSQSQMQFLPAKTLVTMPLLQPTMMLVLNGRGCLRPGSSCGAGAWVWAVATSDVTHPVRFGGL